MAPPSWSQMDPSLPPGRREPFQDLPARWRVCLLPVSQGCRVSCEVLGFEGLRVRRTGFELQFCHLRKVKYGELWDNAEARVTSS